MTGYVVYVCLQDTFRALQLSEAVVWQLIRHVWQ
jgi:hypothetical protein